MPNSNVDEMMDCLDTYESDELAGLVQKMESSSIQDGLALLKEMQVTMARQYEEGMKDVIECLVTDKSK